ncbi:LPXTG cell wall anchor domain-containing protein [Pediococcus ethanolidurans]|uniref:mucin-binding protein n=1 Tax=Pediococcus ethanolidurans TaxID=319653 RepID=UPI0029537C72|nr:MucBP domain-containing protein [Pediococcus ethanolidurans]MDV7718799.1 LPXTG cell wall anchor domain-containing protein [Pediococcus ethanolidurans]
MDGKQRKGKRSRLQRDTEQLKEHYKMYKVGKNWLFAGIVVFFLGTGFVLGTSNVKADSVETVLTTATTQASDGVSQAVSESNSTVTNNSNANSYTTDTINSSGTVEKSASSTATSDGNSGSTAVDQSAGSQSDEKDTTSLGHSSSEATSAVQSREVIESNEEDDGSTNTGSQTNDFSSSNATQTSRGSQSTVNDSLQASSITTTSRSVAKTAKTVKLRAESSSTVVNILGLDVTVSDRTTTNSEETVSVTNKVGTLGNLTNIYVIASGYEVRNMNNQQVMYGSSSGRNLVMCYDPISKETTFAFVEANGDIAVNENGELLSFTFEGDARSPEVRRLIESNSYGDDYYVALNYGGSNVDINFGYGEDNWDYGDLFATNNNFNIPVNYVDQDTGKNIAESTDVNLSTGSQYEVSAAIPPSGYELVGVLKNGTDYSDGTQINDIQIDKSSTKVAGTIQNDLDNNYLADYHIMRYLSVNGSYHIALQDYTDQGGYSLKSSPADLEVKRINQAGDVLLTYTNWNGDVTQSEIIRHGYTLTITDPDDFWGEHINGGAANNLRSIHNDMNLSTPDAITFVYRKVGTQQAKSIVVNYVDESGNVITQNDVLNGIIGASYVANEKVIVDYQLVSVQGNKTGVFTDQEQTVTFIYRLNDSQDTVTNILGVPVTVTTTRTKTDNGSIFVTTSDAHIGDIQHVYAIVNFSEVRTITNQQVMLGASIANDALQGWVSSNLETGYNTRLVLSYDKQTQMTTVTMIDITGRILLTPDGTQIVASFTPDELQNDQSPVQRIIQVGDNLYMSVSYGGANVDVNFADLIDPGDGSAPSYDWNPGDLFSVPTQSNVNVKYVDADTGKELTSLPEQNLDISTGNTYVTVAGNAPDGYQLMGVLNDGTKYVSGTPIDMNAVDAGTNSSNGIYMPDFDENLMENYTISRNIDVGQSYSVILQDYIYGNANTNYQMIYNPINMVVKRLNQQGDVSVTLTDLISQKVDTLKISHGYSDVYSNPNDFWSGYRIFINQLNLNSSANVVYVYKHMFDYDEMTAKRTINYVGAGDLTPKSKVQTITYKMVINRITGEISYTPSGVFDKVGSPIIAGYVPDQAAVAKFIPTASMTSPDDITVIVTYSPAITYRKIKVTRTINYVGAGSKTPETKIQTVVYNTATNELTNETAYTPIGIYERVNSPEISGYAVDQMVVPEFIPTATMSAPFNNSITVTYTPIFEYGQVSITRTIEYVGAGEKTPKTQIQTVVYKTVTNKGTGEISYTPIGVYAAVNSPKINGYTVDKEVIVKVTPIASTTAPINSTVVVTYTPIFEYGQVSTTRTIEYVGAGEKTPKTQIQTVVYKTITNKGTGEISYTPIGVYAAVNSPKVSGYTVDKKIVPEFIPTATTTAPTSSIVTVTYTPLFSYGQLTVTRTINYTGAGNKTPSSKIETLTYNSVTNEGTGETSYTPMGAYAAVKSPKITGYSVDYEIVAEEIPVASLTMPVNQVVLVTYTLIPVKPVEPVKPSNPDAPDTPDTPDSLQTQEPKKELVVQSVMSGSEMTEVRSSKQSVDTQAKVDKTTKMLPQTNEQTTSILSLIGVALLTLWTSLFGLKRKQHEKD